MVSSRWLGFLVFVLLALSACSRAVPRLSGTFDRPEPWPAEFVEEFGRLPVQYDGRVMPVSTFAAFTLYAVHGQRDVKFVTAGDNGADRQVKLSPTEWLLDVWCFPELAGRYPLFRIENVGVLAAIGLEHDGQKQNFEYMAYSQLLPSGGRLEERNEQYSRKPQNARDEIEQRVIQLYRQMIAYHTLHRQLVALQAEIQADGDAVRAVFGGQSRVTVAETLRRIGAFRELVKQAGDKLKEPQYGNLERVLAFLGDAAAQGGGVALFPPIAAKDTEWHTLSEVIDGGLRGSAGSAHTQMIDDLQAGLRAENMSDCVKHLRAVVATATRLATERGDAGTVALESYYYRANWHFHAMMTLLLGFLIGAVACILPRNRWVWWAAVATCVGGIGMLTADIWLRCLVTGYGPIQRLYDTFLFIAGGVALILLLVEFVLPRRIALVLSPLFGVLLILFARLFEVADGKDTMAPLPAVLLSNFWLAVHVPTMNIGYAAGVAAAIVAMAWIAVRVLRIDHPDSPMAKSLVRMCYGTMCFSLATAVVGTILGGVWANDSWGRFWGWDPKENGAMLICLSQIALLHARMAGMVRDAGFCLWSVFTGMIVVFSWFHTNLLGVGLHSYGFSSDLLTGVWLSYTALGTFLVVGAIDVLLRPKPAPFGPPLPEAEPVAS